MTGRRDTVTMEPPVSNWPAMHFMPMRLGGGAPSQLKLIEFNLARNEIRGHDTAGLDFEEIRQRILTLAQEMRDRLQHPNTNLAREEDFPTTENSRVCQWCAFRGVCPDSPLNRETGPTDSHSEEDRTYY